MGKPDKALPILLHGHADRLASARRKLQALPPSMRQGGSVTALVPSIAMRNGDARRRAWPVRMPCACATSACSRGSNSAASWSGRPVNTRKAGLRARRGPTI